MQKPGRETYGLTLNTVALTRGRVLGRAIELASMEVRGLRVCCHHSCPKDQSTVIFHGGILVGLSFKNWPPKSGPTDALVRKGSHPARGSMATGAGLARSPKL